MEQVLMRPLLVFGLAFGGGTALCQYLLPAAVRPWTALVLFALLVPAGLLGGRRERRAARLLCAGVAAGVLWYAGYAALFLAPAEALAGAEDTVTVEVIDYAEESGFGSRCRVRLTDGSLRGEGMFFGSAALLDLEPGDRFTSRAKFYSAVTLAGEARSTYTSRGVFFRLYGKGDMTPVPGRAGRLRYLPQRLAKALRESAEGLYSPRAAGLVTALLTGEREGLDQQSATDLAESGLMHITAVSGLHCGFLALLLSALVLRRRHLTALLVCPALLGYVLAAGSSPSVVRAWGMVSLAFLAPLLGREADAPTSLAAALLGILIFDPFAIASVSLQLSFGAAAGLLLFSPGIHRVLSARCPKLPGMLDRVWSFFITTLAASLAVLIPTAPLSAYYFGTLSLVSPLSSVLVLWMAPVLFAAALVVTALGMVLPVPGILAAVPEALARYVLAVAHALAKIPGHSVRFTGPAAVWWLVLVYVLLAVCLLDRGGSRRRYLTAFAAAAVCLAAMRALPVRAVRGGTLTAVAVDVGQGAAALLHSGDFTALVDCGGTDRPGSAVADILEAYGWGGLDAVVLTHYHEDHAGGLGELLARVEVETLLLPQLRESEGQAALQAEVLALAEEHGVGVSYVEEPREAPLGEAALTVYPPLSAGDANEEGLSVLCTAGAFDLLITGDMAASTERELIAAYGLPDIEVLFAGHHGSKFSTSEELLEAVTPEAGVISVGARNTFGHPAREAMERMAFAGMTLYRTDEQGDIIIQVHERGDGT